MSAQEMRKVIDLLEARRAIQRKPSAVDFAELAGQLVYSWDKIAGVYGSGMDFTLLRRVAGAVAQKKKGIESDNARIQMSRGHDRDDLVSITPDMLLEWIISAADYVWKTIPAADSDFRVSYQQALDDYQALHRTNHDDPYDYIESSDWLTAMEKQKDLAREWSLLRFNEPSTIGQMISRLMFFAEALPSPLDETPPLLISEELRRGIPVIKYVLQAYQQANKS